MSILFVLRFSEAAAKALEKLPADVRLRIWSKLQEAKAEPFRFFIRLKGRDDFKLRVGDYRVIADIVQIGNVIEITKIGHRRNVYSS
ncbi:MAG: type II toxin-antitoxin system RelE/ParE family toxin [DPANN group archaeon]|nr:type II toxin-antitoxin system RelE/ParE family toxin [DPANN group archaeon]